MILCGCASLVPPAPPSGIYYVSAAGSDRNDGGSREQAFRSLFKALALASRTSAKTIVVLGPLDVSSEQSSNNERVFLVQGTGKEQITVRGQASPSGEPAVLSGAGSGRRVILIKGVSNIRFEDIEISGGDCRYDNGGGGMCIGGGAAVTLGPGAVVSGNHSVSLGGGITVAPGGKLEIWGGSVVENSAGGVGGGIAAVGTGEALVMDGGEIRGNRSDGGGGIALYEGRGFLFKSGLVANNEAGIIGGGFVLNNGASLVMDGGAVTGNVSAGSGGGLALLGGAVFTLNGGEIGGNNGAEYGGAVSADASSALRLTGGAVKNNSAGLRGGGFFTSGSLEKNAESACVIYGRDTPADANKAPEGGAVYVSRGGFDDLRRETGAGTGVALDSSIFGTAGGWENAR
jgi:hypothetical protein